MIMGVAGCASGLTPIPEPESAAALLYEEKCSVCHALPHPKRNTAAEWQHLFPLMERRMSERNMAAFSETERETLMKYLRSHAR